MKRALNIPVAELESGTNLPPAFVSLSQSGRSTLFMEFPDFAKNQYLYLNIYSKSDNTLLFSSQIEMHIGDVSKMVGWLNLRNIAGGSGAVPTYLQTPDWPANEHEQGNVVFVHGYNMHEGDETKLWAQNVFKKLWWSGLDRGFVAVQWRGNEGQVFETLTPNYYGNVQNAFQTAPALSNAMQTVQGPKWFIAHSLGNMLVSAAIQDYGMEYEKYFMLNAAVPIEAYDPAGGVTGKSKEEMTPPRWRPYPERVRATHWYELFRSIPNDARTNLTWKGVFKDVDKTINFYSSRDEVVANGNDGVNKLLSREFAWYNQEKYKGYYLVSFSPQAGWVFGDYYLKEVDDGYWNGESHSHYRNFTPDETTEISDESLMRCPFFKDFMDGRVYGTGGSEFVRTNAFVRWYALSHGIPVESFAVGANPVPKWGLPVRGKIVGRQDYREGLIRNVNMAVNCLPDTAEDGVGKAETELPWVHSYFIGNSLFETTILFEALVEQIGSTKPKEVK